MSYSTAQKDQTAMRLPVTVQIPMIQVPKTAMHQEDAEGQDRRDQDSCDHIRLGLLSLPCLMGRLHQRHGHPTLLPLTSWRCQKRTS